MPVVSMGVGASASQHPPVGWIVCPRTASNALRQTPDDNPTINDLIFTARVALDAVPTPGSCTICERWLTSGVGVNRFIWRFDASAHVQLIWAQAAATVTKTSTAVWPAGALEWLWLRTTLDVDNGATQNVVLHETSRDGVTWTTLESITSAGVASVDAGLGYLAVGNRGFGSTLGFNGRVSDLKIENATTVLFEMHTEANLLGVAANATTFTSTSSHVMNVLTSGSPALTLVPPP